MVCAACHCEQMDGVPFCKACGARLGGTPFAGQPGAGLGGPQAGPVPYGVPVYGMPYAAGMTHMRRERVRQNLQPMGITWCLWGVYRLVIGMVAGAAVHAMARHYFWFNGFNEGAGDFVPGFLATFMPIIAVTTITMAGLSLLTGYGLLTGKSWGRTLAIVMAILSLIKIPLGTALGIYTLWVLAPRVSGLEYEALTGSAPGQG